MGLATLASALVVGLVALGSEPDVYTFRSRHYEITTDLEREAAREVARHMDAVFEEYASRLSAFGVKNAKRVRLRVYRWYSDYIEFLASEGINGANTGGMFFTTGGSAYLATFTRGQSERRRQSVLQHEGFHQFAYLRIGETLPRWANEGLAEYFGSGIMTGRGLRLGLVPEGRVERIRRAVRAGTHWPFRELLAMDGAEWSGRVTAGDRRAGLLYAQSWSMVHFLIHARGGRFRPMFEHYLELIGQGWDSMRAFREAFGTDDVASFEQAWREYLTGLEPDPLTAATERLEFLGAGLEMLHERGVTPGSIEALREALRDEEFVLRRWSHGVRRELSAADDSLFEAPDPDGRREAALRLTEARGDGLPPGVEVTGLATPVRLEWSREEGELVRRIEYR